MIRNKQIFKLSIEHTQRRLDFHEKFHNKEMKD